MTRGGEEKQCFFFAFEIRLKCNNNLIVSDQFSFLKTNFKLYVT
jgi:hypothetical protein